MDTIAGPRSRPRSTLDGIVTLCGYLGLFCALAAVAATVVDWRTERDQETWPRATAVVRRCDVEEVHSHLRNAGGREWILRCAAELDVEGQPTRVSIHSHPVTYADDVQALWAWARGHQAGTSIAVRYDPRRPTSAVAEPATMPYTGSRVPDDRTLALLFGAGGALLLAAGATLRRRSRNAASVAVSRTS
jgi:hypothetical protein